MSFSAKTVSRLDWDFAGIPLAEGQGPGNAQGRGVVKEPSEARLDEFEEAFQAIIEVEAVAEGESEKRNVYAEMRSAIADLCGGSPTLEQLEQLPPRYLAAFGRWLLEELRDPKAR